MPAMAHGTTGFQRVPPPLTHLFTVLYDRTTGERFTQPPDDACANPRPDGTGSAWTDVQIDRVQVLFLEGPDHLYAVDMADGHFEVNGVVFRVGPHDPGPCLRRPVFFRRVAMDQHVGARGLRSPGDYRRSYHIGWEAVLPNGPITTPVTIEVGHEVFAADIHG